MDNSLDQFEPLTFEFVPTLRQLMPSTGGLPGVKYGLLAVHNQKTAQNEGWGATTTSKIFTIKGPKGQVDVVLACKGDPVRGMSPAGGARVFLIDQDIYDVTGLDAVEDQEPVPEKSEPISEKPAKADPFDSLPS